jgi:integrase
MTASRLPVSTGLSVRARFPESAAAFDMARRPTYAPRRGKDGISRHNPASFPIRTEKEIPSMKDAPLFASLSNRNGGGRLTTRTLRRIIKARLRAIGIDSDRLTAHSVRHTCITLALQAGATVQEAQALARHANINTTLIYAHNIDRIKQAPERKVAALLSGNDDNISNMSNNVLPINDGPPRGRERVINEKIRLAV